MTDIIDFVLTLSSMEDPTNELQNGERADQEAQQHGLQKKRQLEMGMGRAGGYAGYDDDEFEELGGTQGPLRMTREEGKMAAQTTKRRNERVSCWGRPLA